jgi:hypothetical protein
VSGIGLPPAFGIRPAAMPIARLKQSRRRRAFRENFCGELESCLQRRRRITL